MREREIQRGNGKMGSFALNQRKDFDYNEKNLFFALKKRLMSEKQALIYVVVKNKKKCGLVV